jgi:hypothetical protein
MSELIGMTKVFAVIRARACLQSLGAEKHGGNGQESGEA